MPQQILKHFHILNITTRSKGQDEPFTKNSIFAVTPQYKSPFI